jgi:hypothetical protein
MMRAGAEPAPRIRGDAAMTAGRKDRSNRNGPGDARGAGRSAGGPDTDGADLDGTDLDAFRQEEPPPAWCDRADALLAQIGEPDLTGYPEAVSGMARFMLRLVVRLYAENLQLAQDGIDARLRPYPLVAFDVGDVAARALVARHVGERLGLRIAAIDLPTVRIGR